MIMSKSDFEDDWDTATKNMEESKRDKQKRDNEKNKELRDLKTHASLLQNIQDNTDILCKLGAVIIVLLIIIAFQLFYQLLQLERYKGNDMYLEILLTIWFVIWLIIKIGMFPDYLRDNQQKFECHTSIYSEGVQEGIGAFLAQ